MCTKEHDAEVLVLLERGEGEDEGDVGKRDRLAT